MKTTKYLVGFILFLFAFNACNGNDPLGAEKKEEVEVPEEVNDDPVYVEIDIKPCNNESNNTLELKEVEAILRFVKDDPASKEDNEIGMTYLYGDGLFYLVDKHSSYLAIPVSENMHAYCHICNLPEDITEWNTNEQPSSPTESQKKIILSGTIHVDSITPSSTYGLLEIKSLKIKHLKQ